MDLSNNTKKIIFTIILTIFILGVTISGPKFINKIQMMFGFKGKVELIERCIKTPSCAITTDELDFYENYQKLESSKAGKRFKDSELGKNLEKEEKSLQENISH